MSVLWSAVAACWGAVVGGGLVAQLFTSRATPWRVSALYTAAQETIECAEFGGATVADGWVGYISTPYSLYPVCAAIFRLADGRTWAIVDEVGPMDRRASLLMETLIDREILDIHREGASLVFTYESEGGEPENLLLPCSENTEVYRVRGGP